MEIIFDITEDELPIFLAETGEHLQILDEGLVRLEREEPTPEFIQALFRAAHTLKGAAGMIDHKRMVELTHGMETALDAVRKNQIPISTDLIDTCLEAVDILRTLNDEVSRGEVSPVDIAPLVQRFAELARSGAAETSTKPDSPAAASQPPQGTASQQPSSLNVYAEISIDSVASAARAFQLMLALQEVSQILSMEPNQEQIESSKPVREFRAEIIPSGSFEDIKKALISVSELDRLTINNIDIDLSQPTVIKPETVAPAKPDASSRLGDMLVSNGLITSAQLQAALSRQAETEGPTALLGKTLVQMGFVNQEVLDQVVNEQSQQKAQPARPADTGAEDRSRAHAGDKTIRTSVGRLDALMNLVGELITDRNRLYMIRSGMETRFRGDSQVDTLSETISHVGRITDQLQAEVMSIRMLPISNVFNKFPRMVRDLSRKADKQIDLVIRGEDTELDRSVIEEISDPLIHLLRNSVDHGIETPNERRALEKPERGTILLTARYEQGRIILTVEDDGRGINLERVRTKAVEKGLISDKEAAALSDEEAIDLIFAPGLSTARVVTDVSGRGVGMDIVRNNIERLNGSIVVETWPGKGSLFQIVLPLTLAIVPTLLVRVGKGTYAIPLVTVTETLRVANNEIQTVNSRPVILLRDHVLPVTRLANVFEITAEGIDSRYKYVVVVRSGKSQMGLIVDTLIGEQEVVVKSLSTVVGEVTGISSAAILGDGQVALIVDVPGLFKLATHNLARYV